MSSDQKCVMIIAGEASGDLHGAMLVRAMHERNNALFFCGIGGQALKNAGVRIVIDASELAVVGITEAVSKIPNILKGMAVAKNLLKSLGPDLLILIDFPDFNLHIAATAKKLKIPVLYYISPQIWAWRSGRVKKIGKLVNHMAVILPFEEEFYRQHEIPATFVGHPLLDKNLPETINVRKNGDVQKNRGEPARDMKENSIGLLPGSRDREVSRHLPLMIEAARILSSKIRDIKFIVSLAPSVGKKYVEDIIKKCANTEAFELTADPVEKIFERCRLVIAASGTVTLEAAIFGTPMVIIYKVSSVSYWLGRALIKVKHIGLANLIAGKEIVPELVQKAASPENIAETVSKMLGDVSGIESLRKELLGLRDALGGPGASNRVADIALNML